MCTDWPLWEATAEGRGGRMGQRDMDELQQAVPDEMLQRQRKGFRKGPEADK